MLKVGFVISNVGLDNIPLERPTKVLKAIISRDGETLTLEIAKSDNLADLQFSEREINKLLNVIVYTLNDGEAVEISPL